MTIYRTLPETVLIYTCCSGEIINKPHPSLDDTLWSPCLNNQAPQTSRTVDAGNSQCKSGYFSGIILLLGHFWDTTVAQSSWDTKGGFLPFMSHLLTTVIQRREIVSVFSYHNLIINSFFMIFQPNPLFPIQSLIRTFLFHCHSPIQINQHKM